MSQEKFNKFEFDTDFFELATQAAATADGATPPPPKLPKNVAEAKEQGYTEGYTAAQSELQSQYQAELEGMRTTCTAMCTALEQSMEGWQQQALTQLLSLMRVSLHRLLGHAAANYPEQLLENHLRTMLNDLRTHEDLTLRIAPAARGFHEKLGLSHANLNGVPMHILPDAAIAPTDALVEWQHGGMESRLAQHIEALDALLLGVGAQALPVPSTPAPITPPPTASSLPETGPTTAASLPPHPPEPFPIPEAAQTVRSRAAELLGDDDLVDALK